MQSSICLDDGTGRHVYYIDENGKRSRHCPDNFVYEVLENGQRKYYFRGTCIRCKNKTSSIFIPMKQGSIGYSINYCSNCIVATTPNLPSNKIKFHGDLIWEANSDVPKIFYSNLEEKALIPNREEIITNRSIEAQLHVRNQVKLRRNRDREDLLRSKGLEYNIYDGIILSWGHHDTLFDEYIGEAENGVPHGIGVKFYSDGSVYHGRWFHGKRHAPNSIGLWTRTNDIQYEGNWQNDFKHGRGKQTYADGSVYTGEFAKGYEHGHGLRAYSDGSKFEGRYRFGKKDGPGIFTTAEGQKIKKNFKETEVIFDVPLPEVEEEIVEGKVYLQPPSLTLLAISALSKAMHSHQIMLNSSKLTNRLPEYIKSIVANEFLLIMIPQGSLDFLQFSPSIAFKLISTVSLCSIKITYYDTDSLLYFISSNKILMNLQLVANKLTPSAIDLISKYLSHNTWPILESLDLSMNKITATGIKNVVNGIKHCLKLKKLKLSACNVDTVGAVDIARYVSESSVLQELDLSFNSVQAAGAEVFSEAIQINKSLTSLNLRQNNIGTLGGQLLADAMQFNFSIRTMCLVDNKIGPELITLLCGRLRGSIKDVSVSVRANEMTHDKSTTKTERHS
eukprot:gene13639-18302_t